MLTSNPWRELYRRLLISLFPQSPSLQLLYPGLPRTPWNRNSDKERLCEWYGLRSTRKAFRDGLMAGLGRHSMENSEDL